MNDWTPPARSDRFLGMTVRERLFEIGKLHEFDVAKAEQDRQKVRQLLEEVEVDEPSIKLTNSRLSLSGAQRRSE